MNKREKRIPFFPSKIFLLTEPKNFVVKTFLCFRKLLVSKNLLNKRGADTIFGLTFTSHGNENFLRGTPLCFKKSLVMKKFSRWEWGGEYHDFLSKKSCLTTKKLRRGSLLCFRKLLISYNSMDMRGGSITIFLRKCFVSPYLNIRYKSASVFEKVSGIDNICAKLVNIMNFCRKTSVSQ